MVEVPSGFGDADNGDVERPSLDHGLQRGEDLFVGEVAGGSEEDQGVGVGDGLDCGGLRGQKSRLLVACCLFSRGLFEVAAELVAHGGEKFIREVGVSARAEALV